MTDISVEAAWPSGQGRRICNPEVPGSSLQPLDGLNPKFNFSTLFLFLFLFFHSLPYLLRLISRFFK